MAFSAHYLTVMSNEGDHISHQITHPKKIKFLAAFAVCGSVRKAAEIAEIHRRTHYDWMDQPGDEGDSYRKAFSDARLEACEALEDEARRRAIDGVDRPVLFQGKPVFVWKDGAGNIVEENTPGATKVALVEKGHSDTLLIALLNANLPEKFKYHNYERGSTTIVNDQSVNITVEQRRAEIRGLLVVANERAGNRPPGILADGQNGHPAGN
jgi:hypothetical protein